ncbi:MAG TPA: FecR domain-containing protein [Pyrinomonadaceae bacterium]|nr:FecR domain-containing protein [Pyrinomonadaceae bacterium]
MATKVRRFDLDWWVVQKRFVYMLLGTLVLLILAGGAAVYAWKYGLPFGNGSATAKAPAGARFISFEGDVRVVRAATRETISASIQTQLFPGDTVQTQADGRARINLADGSILVVRENSTVIIRDNTSAEGGQKVNVNVVVDRGQVNVRTEDQPQGTNNVVQTRQTQSKLGPQTGATFGINPDSTEDIRVSQGQMETTSVKTGETTTVRGGEYLNINPSGNIARREKLLDVPSLAAPHDLERIFVGSTGAASVTLRWQRPVSGSAAHYRVEVATSPFFVAAGKVIERDQLAATEFNASDLRPGNYFWRVRATATTGQVSDWSDPQKFIVVPAGSNENLAVTITETNYIGGQIYLVRGRAQPGTTIRIGGRQTLTGSNGAFQLQITVPEGAREVGGEAQDPQGNRTRFNLALMQSTASRS